MESLNYEGKGDGEHHCGLLREEEPLVRCELRKGEMKKSPINRHWTSNENKGKENYCILRESREGIVRWRRRARGGKSLVPSKVFQKTLKSFL